MSWGEAAVRLMPLGTQRLLFRVLERQRYLSLATRKRWPAGKRGSLARYDELKCLFVHIPKTAGMSVSRALFGEAIGHDPLYCYRIVYPRATFESYFKFTFVRNPWDRLVSAYTYMLQPERNEQLRTFASGTMSRYAGFDDFVRRWLPRHARRTAVPHFLSQSSWITIRGKLGVDFVGRMERLEEDFAAVCARLGVKATLPHENRSPRDRDYRRYYTERSRRVVSEVYAEDVQRFGYTF